MRHGKPGRPTNVQLGYAQSLPPLPGELDDLRNFDDRTLLTFVGCNVAHLSDEDEAIVRSLERWRDRA